MLPRPSLIEAAKTSSRAGPSRCRSKKTAPRRRWSATRSSDVLAHRLEQRMAGRDPLQRRVGRQERLVEDDLAVLAAEPAEPRLQPLADRQRLRGTLPTR